MHKTSLILLFIMTFSFMSFAQSFINKDSIFEQSIAQHKDVFLVFSGSDWCANCIRFNKNIGRDPAFQDFIKTDLLYLNADFPQRKKQSSELKKQNETLAEIYNPNGIFPTLLLISPANKITPVYYQHETVQEFIIKINKIIYALKEND